MCYSFLLRVVLGIISNGIIFLGQVVKNIVLVCLFKKKIRLIIILLNDSLRLSNINLAHILIDWSKKFD